MGCRKGFQALPFRKKGIWDSIIQAFRRSRRADLRAGGHWRLREDINPETVTGGSRRGKKSRLHEQTSMHFFDFSAADVPTSWCLSLEMAQAKLGAGDQLLFCGVAGRRATSAHRTLSSPLERIGSCCKWSLVSVSPSPSCQRGRLCVAVCLPCQGSAGPEDHTKRSNPSILEPSLNSCEAGLLGRASPGPKARGLLSRGGNSGEGS